MEKEIEVTVTIRTDATNPELSTRQVERAVKYAVDHSLKAMFSKGFHYPFNSSLRLGYAGAKIKKEEENAQSTEKENAGTHA
jgi:hypothetical protein